MGIGAQTVCLVDKVYIGDVNTLFVYSHTTDAWNTLSPPVVDYALVVYNSKLVLVGGITGSVVTNKLWTLEHKEWKNTLPPMSIGRSHASAVEYSDNLLVAGGLNDEKKAIATVEVYSRHRDQWANAQCLWAACFAMNSAILSGCWYLAAGSYSPDKHIYFASMKAIVETSQSDAQKSSSLWTKLADTPHDNSRLAIYGNRLVAVGWSAIHAYSPYSRSFLCVEHFSDTPGAFATAISVLPGGDLMVVRYSCLYRVSLNGE